MDSVLVRSIYTVDTISKGKSKAWVKLMAYMESRGERESVEFDFKGIEVVEPWDTPEFLQFMSDERVHLKLWCSGVTVNSINVMCRLNGYSDNRAINIDIEQKKVPTKEEMQILRMSDELQVYFEESGEGYPVLNVYKRFDQVGVPITVSYIEAALKKYANEHGVRKIKVEFRGIAIQPIVIERITDLIEKLGNIGVELLISSEDEEVMNKVGLYRTLSSKKVLSEKEKVGLIQKVLYPYKVGMLIKYKYSRAVDEFGRSGKGKPVSCRAAIYYGIGVADGKVCVKIRAYHGDTFYTQAHWLLEHDNELLDKLEYTDEIIPIEQFGMYDEFLGSRYHFITPVQMDGNREVMYSLDGNGKVVYNMLTIPERMKVVFDDWGIKYDGVSLQAYIKKTEEILGLKGQPSNIA